MASGPLTSLGKTPKNQVEKMGKEHCCIRGDFVVSLDKILKAANKVKTSGSKQSAEVKPLLRYGNRPEQKMKAFCIDVCSKMIFSRDEKAKRVKAKGDKAVGQDKSISQNRCNSPPHEIPKEKRCIPICKYQSRRMRCVNLDK